MQITDPQDVCAGRTNEGRESIPAIISALKDEDSDVANAAIESLSLFGPRLKDAAPALAALIIRKLADREPSDYYDDLGAIKALRRIDPAGKFAIPDLIEVLKHQDGKPEVERPAAINHGDGDSARRRPQSFSDRTVPRPRRPSPP